VKETTPTINLLNKKTNKDCVRRFCKIAKKSVYPNIQFKLHHNARFNTNDFLDVLTHVAISGDFTENGSNTFRLTRKDTPSADDLLFHLKKFSSEEVKVMFQQTFKEICKIAKKMGVFNKSVDVAIDFIEHLYYGNKNDPMVLGTKHQRGTDKAYKYASIDVVEPGKRFTLMALPIGHFLIKENVVKELIEFARKIVKIKRLYIDRGFYSMNIINLLNDINVKFLMPIPRTKGVKKAINNMSLHSSILYEMKDRKKVKARFFLVKTWGSKDRMIMGTNMEARDSRTLPVIYKKRWGIESGYRVKNYIRPRTTSKNYVVRLFYFMFSVCLYNLWILASIFIAIAKFFQKIEKPLITVKLFGIALYSEGDRG
jgi:putative transposase